MIPQFNHNLVTSVTMWLDNRICDDAQAYENVGSPFYRQSHPSNVGYVWASPYKTFVFDSCVSGANVMSGAYTSSGQFLTRASGLVIDYLNGRVISPHDWGTTLSGNFARKEINTYFSTKQEINYWLEHIYGEDVNLGYTPTGAPPFRFAAPCVILTNARGGNDPFALGGLRDTEATFRIFAITKDNYTQEGLNSLIMDSAQKYIPICTYADTPLNSSGDLKGGSFNYCTGIYDRYGCGNGAYIKKTYSIKINELANKNNNYLLSVMEMDLSIIRVPS